jgi:alpha-beta hydrolase superfamily lysophospholipase
VAQEVDDVLAVAHQAGQPLIIYGHSSGGVVALEALVASPSSFAGAVIFEPASVIEAPWAGEDGEVIKQARAALAAGKPARALAIFTRRATGYPAWQAWSAGVITALIPRYRRLVSCQIDDLEAMDQLGNRLSAFAQNTVPTVLLSGDRSPAQNTAVSRRHRTGDATHRTSRDAQAGPRRRSQSPQGDRSHHPGARRQGPTQNLIHRS